MQRDIAYGPDPEQIFDLYHAATVHPLPLVIFLHGGGWTRGSKNVAGRVAPLLQRHGYAVASLDYRLAPRAGPEQAVQDAARAIAYVVQHAGRFGIETARIAILGHSAGGHIAALLATDGRFLTEAGLHPALLAAVVTLDGIFDVPMLVRDHPTAEMHALFGDDPAGWARLSPAHCAAHMSIDPVFCQVYGDVHRSFPRQAASFEAAMHMHGRRLRTVMAPGVAHMDMLRRFADAALPIAACVLESFALGVTAAARGAVP